MEKHAGLGFLQSLLLFVPLSIYVAALRALYSGLPAEEVPILAWIFVVVPSACIFAVISTVVLVRMVEATMWLAVKFIRRRARHLADVRSPAPFEE